MITATICEDGHTSYIVSYTCAICHSERVQKVLFIEMRKIKAMGRMGALKLICDQCHVDNYDPTAEIGLIAVHQVRPAMTRAQKKEYSRLLSGLHRIEDAREKAEVSLLEEEEKIRQLRRKYTKVQLLNSLFADAGLRVGGSK